MNVCWRRSWRLARGAPAISDALHLNKRHLSDFTSAPSRSWNEHWRVRSLLCWTRSEINCMYNWWDNPYKWITYIWAFWNISCIPVTSNVCSVAIQPQSARSQNRQSGTELRLPCASLLEFSILVCGDYSRLLSWLYIQNTISITTILVRFSV